MRNEKTPLETGLIHSHILTILVNVGPPSCRLPSGLLVAILQQPCLESKSLFPMSTNTPFIMVPVSVAFDNSLPDKARRLWEALEHFSGNNRTCWVGYKTLAKMVGCSVRWIPELVRRLVKAGLLIVQYRQGSTNIYTLMGRVARRQATQEVYSRPPKKHSSYNQKQPTKTNIKGGSTPSKEPTTEEKFKKTAAFLRGEKVDWSK